MSRWFVRLSCLFIGFFLVLSGAAFAQSAISGVVRDTSGAVMPGVTVEAASPVLIEKVRAAVTDDQGRYTIVDLRPGTYTVTFTLTGFNTLKREGLELPANFTATDQRRTCASARSRNRSPSPARRRSSTSRTRSARSRAEPRAASTRCRRRATTRPGGADARRAHEQHRRRRQPADGTDLHDASTGRVRPTRPCRSTA